MKPVSLLGAALLVLGTAAPALATPGDRDAHAAGFYVSNMAGSGLTYARSFDNGWGFHVSGIGWGQAGTLFVNAGGAVTRVIDRRDWGTLYALGAVGVAVDNFTGQGGLPSRSQFQTNVTPGLGFTWGPVVAEVGYSVFTNPTGLGFSPAGGFGLMWWF